MIRADRSFRFDQGDADDGTLTVGRDRFYGEEYVVLETSPVAGQVHLTAEQARAVARELAIEADALDVSLPG